MLEKEVLEKYLNLCMKSQADFAEIYEEDEKSETVGKVLGLTDDERSTECLWLFK